MQKVEQEFLFSTNVSDSKNTNEFIVEFSQLFPAESLGSSPAKITRNFDELIDFLEELEE